MKSISFLFGIAWVLVMVIMPSEIQAATLSLDPPSGTINKGCEISIKINLDTEGVQTDGTDAIISYTPSQLSTTTAQIAKGTIYNAYPGIAVDSQSGKISISGISDVPSPFSGSGTFATMKLNVANTLTDGTKVNLTFEFDPNNKTETTDTNVVERGTVADVLNSVVDGNYTVGSGSCTSGITAGTTPGQGDGSLSGGGQGQTLPGTTTSATPSAQYQVYKPDLNNLTGGKAGILDNTIVLTSVGAILVILGIVGLSML